MVIYSNLCAGVGLQASELCSSMLVGDGTMSQQRLVAGRCAASSSSSSVAPAAVASCIHRPFEDPPCSSPRHSGHTAAFPDSTATLLHRPTVRGKAPSDVDPLQMPALDWINTSARSTATTSAELYADGVDSSSSDSELQYSNDACIQNISPPDGCNKKRMIHIFNSTFFCLKLLI